MSALVSDPPSLKGPPEKGIFEKLGQLERLGWRVASAPTETHIELIGWVEGELLSTEIPLELIADSGVTARDLADHLKDEALAQLSAGNTVH